MKKKRIIMICISTLILILFLIILVMSFNKKEKVSSPPNPIPKNEQKEPEKENTLIEEEKQEDDNFEIMESSDLKTDIESLQGSRGFENYRLATDTDKANYEITKIKKKSDSKKTIITGKIKNNGGSENIVLKVEFTGKINSSSSIEIKNLKVGQTKDFDIRVLNNAATNDYTVYVEYVGE